MATQWGRKETVIWPPHVPIISYTAIAAAILCTCLFVWQRLTFSLDPLQRSYITEYVRSGIGSIFKAHESYRLIYLGGDRAKPRLAFTVDFVPGQTILAGGKIVPVALSNLARAQGYRSFDRGPEQKLADISLNRWLRLTVFDDQGILRLFAISFVEGGVCLAAMLWFAVPYDIRRFKQMKYGRILRGPQLLSPEEFNRQQKGDGIGFKTTELGKMMRIPARKEAQTLPDHGRHRRREDAAHHANLASDSRARRLSHRLRSCLRIRPTVLRQRARGHRSESLGRNAAHTGDQLRRWPRMPRQTLSPHRFISLQPTPRTSSFIKRRPRYSPTF